MATALEYTQEWLEDLDSTEDSMKFERGVLATLSDGAAAVRNELEGRLPNHLTISLHWN